jgi:microcystin-dependent protein
MKKQTLAVLAIVGLALMSLPAAAGSNPFLGEVETFAFNFCPLGWVVPNGQLMPINQNQALFSLLGTTYGGDGKSTFALPVIKPTFTISPGSPPLTICMATLGIFPSRN